MKMWSNVSNIFCKNKGEDEDITEKKLLIFRNKIIANDLNNTAKNQVLSINILKTDPLTNLPSQHHKNKILSSNAFIAFVDSLIARRALRSIQKRPRFLHFAHIFHLTFSRAAL